MTTNLNTKLINAIIGSKEQVEFLQNKLAFLEKLTNEYDSISFDERLINIIDNAYEINFDGIIYETYKNIGELVINYKLDIDDFIEDFKISNLDIIEKYNIVAPNGVNTVYDSILSEFDIENITDSDIKKFKQQIIKDFNLKDKAEYQRLVKVSILELEDDSEVIMDYLTDCERYLNKLIKDTQYIVEIYQTDDVYEDDEESFYHGRAMYEGKIKHKDTEEELDDSLTGRYCEISSVFEDLLGYINSEILNQIQEINDWLEDSCCPECKGFNYASKQDFEGNEIFRNWTCSCGAVWTERYNLTKVFYGGQDKEIKSDLEENLAYENKRMGDFLERLGLSPSQITDIVINGDEIQIRNTISKLKEPKYFKISSTSAQEILDLFSEVLHCSSSSITHDYELERIFLEIDSSDYEYFEFTKAYDELKNILGIKELDSFILIDY
ncbi:hypothetical protein N3114_05460 [Aliarcobacter butzleri]|uniref:hypothetical protein n=1 Tax=Aliarcobacter butzleri TaxID=28197 RepID=UPI0021B15961|nr:hypothetical protein [Aliarcobacter butzleri]UXC30465.1 hypothetical protein N3114_05460 [Aliarcobacter butzleri]